MSQKNGNGRGEENDGEPPVPWDDAEWHREMQLIALTEQGTLCRGENLVVNLWAFPQGPRNIDPAWLGKHINMLCRSIVDDMVCLPSEDGTVRTYHVGRIRERGPRPTSGEVSATITSPVSPARQVAVQ